MANKNMWHQFKLSVKVYGPLVQYIILNYIEIKSCMNALYRTEFPYEVGHAMLKWVYTDQIDVTRNEDAFHLGLLKAARKFQLTPLSDR